MRHQQIDYCVLQKQLKGERCQSSLVNLPYFQGRADRGRTDDGNNTARSTCAALGGDGGEGELELCFGGRGGGGFECGLNRP